MRLRRSPLRPRPASDDAIRAGLSGFSGVKRRFTHVGEWQGVHVYDDYAHHPVEIAAVLRAARVAGDGRVIAVIQPHRYTRLQACSTNSPPASTTPISLSSRRSIPLAKFRSQASTATSLRQASPPRPSQMF